LTSTTGQNNYFIPTTANLVLASVTGSAASTKTDTLILDGTSTGNAITGAIIDGSGGGSLALTKQNTSTWTLSGANTYSGNTKITAGNLQIDNANGTSGLGSGTVAVSASATLSGTGFNSGKVTVTGGGQIAPGTNGSTPSGAPNSNFGSAGVLTLGSTGGLTLTSATLDFDLAPLASGTSDEISTTALALTSVSTVFNGLGSSLQLGQAYVLIHYTGTATGSGAAAFSNANTTFVGTLAGLNYSASYSLDTVGDNVDVTFSATPEPGSMVVFTVGGMALMSRRRRWKAPFPMQLGTAT
jgi:autotransporter-associated beta strand protein